MKREKKRGGRGRREEGVEIKPSKPKVWNLDFCMETKLKYGFMEF